MRLDLSTARARYRLGRARIWLRLARYWQTSGDLDEAARHAHRALRLLHGSPVELAGEVTLTLAEIETDRCEYASGRARLVQLVDELDGLPAAGRAGRLLLARALTSLGDAHRRAGRYPQAIQTSRRACQLLEDPVAAQPDLLAAALTTLAITHKEVGEFEQAQQLYARVEQIRQEAGADDGQLADLHHNLAGLAYARQRYSRPRWPPCTTSTKPASSSTTPWPAARPPGHRAATRSPSSYTIWPRSTRHAGSPSAPSSSTAEHWRSSTTCSAPTTPRSPSSPTTSAHCCTSNTEPPKRRTCSARPSPSPNRATHRATRQPPASFATSTRTGSPSAFGHSQSSP